MPCSIQVVLRPLLGKDEQLSGRDGRPGNLGATALAIVLEPKGPAQYLHHVQYGADGILLVVLLKVVIHLAAVMSVPIGLELQGFGRTDEAEGGQLLVDGVDHGGADGRPVQGEGFFGGHLKSAGLDLERLLEDDVGHDLLTV